MNKITVILILTLIVILGVVPFFLTQQSNETLAIGTNVVSAISSIVTLLIALLLYSKYGLEKSFVDKQTDTVFRLLIALKKTRFEIKWGESSILWIGLNRLNEKFYTEYNDMKLLVSPRYADNLKYLWDITDEIFLPSAIKEKMRPQMIPTITSIPGNNYANYGRLGIYGMKKTMMMNGMGH